MEVIYLLIPLSLMFLAVSIAFFFYAMKTHQYDDMEGPAHRVVLDDREWCRQQSESRASTAQETSSHD